MKRTAIATLVALTMPVWTAATALAGSDDVVVENAWSRASVGIKRPGAAYMEIRNTGSEPVTITGIRTDLAKKPEIHRSSTNEQGVSTMAPAGDIAIAPGATVALKPGGLHAMLMKLQAPMKKGETFWLTLTFSDGGTVTIEVPILGIGARGPEG